MRPVMRAEWRPRVHSYLGGIIRKSFVDELKELLEKAGIEYDEKYLL